MKEYYIYIDPDAAKDKSPDCSCTTLHKAQKIVATIKRAFPYAVVEIWDEEGKQY